MWPGPTAQLAPLALLALAIAFPVSLVWRARRGRMLLAVRLATADALLVASVLVILRVTLPSTQPGDGLGSWTWMPFEDLIRAWPIDWARRVILDQMAAHGSSVAGARRGAGPERRELVEYWAHEASLFPVALQRHVARDRAPLRAAWSDAPAPL